MFPIVDMHCDLLSFVITKSDIEKALHDPISLASLDQQKKGGVTLQILAMFGKSDPGSVACFEKQTNAYTYIRNKHSQGVETWNGKARDHHVGYSIENASLLLEESEPFDLLQKRFTHLIKIAGPMAYISLTWNDENRFGGGNLSQVGLKEDGKRLLELMAENSIKQKIAIDFSHTSDKLAEDILNFIDQRSLKLTPIASHSNYRAVQDVKRNLPSDIALEIGKRGGIIGLNMVSRFLGSSPKSLLDHIGRGLELRLEHAIVFGADFFGPTGIPALDQGGPYFFDQISNASTYPHILEKIHTMFDAQLAENIAYKNALHYFERAGFTPKQS